MSQSIINWNPLCFVCQRFAFVSCLIICWTVLIFIGQLNVLFNPLQFWTCLIIPIAHKVLSDLTSIESIRNDSVREVPRCFPDHSFTWFSTHLLGVYVLGTSCAMLTKIVPTLSFSYRKVCEVTTQITLESLGQIPQLHPRPESKCGRAGKFALWRSSLGTATLGAHSLLKDLRVGWKGKETWRVWPNRKINT